MGSASTVQTVTSVCLFRELGTLCLRRSSSDPPLAMISNDYGTVLLALEEYPDLTLQYDLVVESGLQRRKHSVVVSVTLYGPLATCRYVADYLYDADIYLQIPVRASLNVPYYNPQSLSCDIVNAPLTFDLQATAERELQSTLDPASLLEVNNEDLPETTQSAKIKSSMYRHQRQALTFMAQREGAASTYENKHSLHVDQGFRDKSKNTLQVLHKCIDLYRGGILADAMGLGKTLSMISLICQHQGRRRKSNAGTLIVVPLSLLKTWHDQLNRHLRPGAVTWMVYHTSNAPLESLQPDSVDIVITTYDVIATHWNRGDRQTLLLFALTWDRLVLDEAHEVRSASTLRAEAVSQIRAQCRWAVTGTPIQNHTDDLASLLRVLNVFPDIAFRRLKALCRDIVSDEAMKIAITRICLRRSKKAVSLPQRIDMQQLVLFGEEEWKAYRKIQTQARDQFRSDQSRFRAHALMKVNALRLICNLGLRISGSTLGGSADNEISRDLLDTFSSTTSTSCLFCGQNESVLDSSQDNDQFEPFQSSALVSSCGSFICGNCASIVSYEHLRCNCSAAEVCHYERLDSRRRVNPSLPEAATEYTSTKISALVDSVQDLPLGEKALVFSAWTTTLIAAEEALTARGIGLCTLHGSHTANQRWATIHQFNTDEKVRVLLISIRCGSTGITLTRANHVFLMEPQWNPMLEEQALCRVHRIGQTRPVRTVRFIVSGTIEEKIREIQSDKKRIFEGAFKISEAKWMDRVQELIA